MKTGLVLGVNGQDGSYLAEILIERGYQVTGAARQAVSRWVDPGHFRYVALDVADAPALDALLAEVLPDEIYHMAAIHGSAGHSYEAHGARRALNIGSVHLPGTHPQRSRNTRLFSPVSEVWHVAVAAHRRKYAPRRAIQGITKRRDRSHQYYHTSRSLGGVGYCFNHDRATADSYFLPILQLERRPDGQTWHSTGDCHLDFCATGKQSEFMELTADLSGQSARSSPAPYHPYTPLPWQRS
jgi:hypothetical protein